MQKPSFPFLFCILFSLTIIGIQPLQQAHADDLSEGMALYNAGKQKEAIPLLEKAAKDGHEEAIEALDKIYGDQSPAIDTKDAIPADGKKNAKGAKKEKDAADNAQPEAKPEPMYERVTTAEDPDEVAERASMKKILVVAIVIVLILAGIIQYYVMRRMRNRSYRPETEQDLKRKNKKPGR